jgi:hypothetical protein
VSDGLVRPVLNRNLGDAPKDTNQSRSAAMISGISEGAVSDRTEHALLPLQSSVPQYRWLDRAITTGIE